MMKAVLFTAVFVGLNQLAVDSDTAIRQREG
jgi:hypothetical protein